jgi:RNA polymerase sigma-70 factor (ECF subfamily)
MIVERLWVTSPPKISEAQNEQEAAIMRAAQADLQRFAPLYERYCVRIYAYCLRRVGDEREAEDLTSSIFTRALQGIDSYHGGMVSAWLFRIAHNAVANHHRARTRELPLEDADALSGDGEPAERMTQAEESAAVSRLVDDLSEAQRDLLALRLNAGLTSDQIGALLGKSAGAVRVELHRLIRHLRTRYEQEEGR